MKDIIKAISILLSVIIILPGIVIPALADTENESISMPEDYIYTQGFSLPENMRGTFVTPGTDFYIISEDDEEFVPYTEQSLRDELKLLYDNIDDFGLNTVIIYTTNGDELFYNTDLNKTAKIDPLLIATEVAYEYGFNVFFTFDVGQLISGFTNDKLVSNSLSALNDAIITETHKFAIKYRTDGYILTNYYNSRSINNYNAYMKNGSGIGYDNWLYDCAEYYFATISDVIHKTNNTIPVGIMIDDMWANASDMEGGSETNDYIQAYFDGYSDTKKYVSLGLADFVTVRAYGSIDDTDLPYENIVNWWGELANESEVPMYVVHSNEKITTSAQGWLSEDQLLRQLTLSKDIPGYNGSVFNSYETLVKNPYNTTTKLKQYFNDLIDEDSLFNELTIVMPQKLNTTTYNPTQKFSGTFDPNFDVYFNGDKIELNDAGNFYYEEPLNVGVNTFTISHKGVTKTFKITRKVEVLKSMDPTKALKVDGGTKIEVTAIAYRGASVTANINGKTIKLKEMEAQSDEVGDPNSYYAKFVGKYTVPDGIIGETQSLGKVTVYGEYLGQKESLSGGKVTVNALPEPPPVIESELLDQYSVGTGEVVGKIDPIRPAGEVASIIQVINNYTSVYNAKTTSAILTPNFSQLPAGTLDYYKDSSGDYYISDSGKRYSVNDASVIDGYTFGDNKLTVTAVGFSGGDGYIKINLAKKISYNIETNVSYADGEDGEFYVKNFNPDYVYITFDNVTQVTKLPTFDKSYVFNAGEWETVDIDGIPKFRLKLTLRQQGIYGGSSSYYNDNGELVIKFNCITNSLAGKSIVIDPGHGYGLSADKWDPGAIGHVVEQEINLAVAKQLAEKLSARGANVVRLKTESEYFLTKDRPNVARQYNCDLFISLHCNAASGSASGVEVYYFTPYSQPLAKSLSSNLAAYYENNVYKDGVSRNRGDKYSYFWVTLQHDFPSVLVEMGFVDNYNDAMAMAKKTHQNGMANALVSGIEEFFACSSLTYTPSDGSVGIPGLPDDVFAEVSDEASDDSIGESSPETIDTSAGDAETDEQSYDNEESYAEPYEPYSSSESVESYETIETMDTTFPIDVTVSEESTVEEEYTA